MKKPIRRRCLFELREPAIDVVLQPLQRHHCLLEVLCDVCLEAGLHGGDVVERLLHLCAEGVHQVGEVRQLGVPAWSS